MADEDSPLFRAMLGEAWHRNADAGCEAPRSGPALPLAPSTLREPVVSHKRRVRRAKPRGLRRVLGTGVRQLVTVLACSACCFLLGAMLVPMPLAPAIFIGVLLMLAGLGGMGWAQALLWRWLAHAEHAVERRTRVMIHVLGVVAFITICIAFIAALVPRGLWPI